MSSETTDTGERRTGRYDETDFHGSRGGGGGGDSRDEFIQEEAEAVTSPDPSYRETNFHVSPVGDRPLQGQVEIAGEEWSVETVVEVERLRRRYRDEFRECMVALGEPTRRGILACLVQSSPTTYAELSDWTSTTTRTVKNHVHDLRDAGVVEVRDGRPASIGIRNDDLRLLVSDALSFLG